MRLPNLTTTLGLVLLGVCLTAPALAQHHAGQPPSNFVQKDNAPTAEHKRKGDLDGFGQKNKPPEKEFPWRALGLGVLCLMAATPFAWIMYRSANKDLTEMKTVGRVTEGTKGAVKEKGAAKGGEKPQEGGSEPRDRVWEAMQSVSQWVPVDWVARTAGLTDDESRDELQALASEGYLETAKDKAGNPIFRTKAA